MFCWLELDVSLLKLFSSGSFLSQSDNSSSSSKPTCVIFFELIPSLVPDTWSKSWKYALNWGAYPLFLLLSFACWQVSFRVLILSLQCQIDFAGPAATTETFISAQTLWLLVLSVNLKFSFHELTNFGVWLATTMSFTLSFCLVRRCWYFKVSWWYTPWYFFLKFWWLRKSLVKDLKQGKGAFQ